MNKFLAALTISAALLGADSIKIDSPLNVLDNFKYETPTGRQMKIPQKTKLVIVAFDKDTGALINEYLDTQNKFYLLKHNSIFIADINKMPSIITSMFALPKLQKYKHLIYLHYGDKFQNSIPNKEEKITLLRVEDSKIKEISFISSKQELKAAIEK
ncbi:hypothetical protein [Sulfurimonas sp.]|jgi:hypothetical protein|uniref:hypothetical protein n=1 Tax=Sulfurimonas sp. TaxID=2022749 RepID=UPI0025E3A3C7|nr:hypothetical protein [Sulfurimonas sp.]MCK9472555.1 hypothetical protein [Sulfurimonas sp.]